MLDRIAGGAPFGRRFVLANRWLFGPLVVRDMERAPVTNAMVRTTTAPTMLAAGIKENVLPTEASAVVNFRLLPGDTLDGLEAQVRAIIDDPGIEIGRGEFQSEPSPVAATDTASFALLERTVNEVFPDALVTPGLVVGGTDNRHYAAVRDHGYNFLPLALAAEDLPRFHGANERVAVAGHARAVAFYARLIANAAGP
jgi:carboxypeptidase PM20D1